MNSTASEINATVLTDVALGKPTLQSSILPEHAEYGSSCAVDGTGDESFFHTEHEASAWWQADLGAPHIIDRISLYNRPGFESRAGRLTLVSSLDGVTWTVLHRKTDEDLFGSSEADHYEIALFGENVARFVRVAKATFGCLHLSRISVYGRPATLAEERTAFSAEHARGEAHKAGRTGEIGVIDTFNVFIDADYSPEVRQTLEGRTYEARERRLVQDLLQPGDRVLEAGTAIGLVSMNAAGIVGADAVVTFDANPRISQDAQRNFRANGLRINSRVGVLRNRADWDPSQTETDFYISKHLWGSRLFASPTDGDIVEVVRVPYVLLEEQIEASRANVLLCDIEGGEADLLTRADLTGIRLIIVETHYWAVGRARIDGMVRALVTSGFNIDLDLTAGQVAVLRRS